MEEEQVDLVPQSACTERGLETIGSSNYVSCPVTKLEPSWVNAQASKNSGTVAPHTGGRKQRKMRRQSKSKSKRKVRRNKNSKFSRHKRSSK